MALIKKNKEYLILAFVAFLFISPQLYYHSMIVGFDWWFHWSRFYEAAMQIKNGHINYFQSLYAFSQTGRVINAMYGGDFAYLHGLLLLIMGSWLRAEVVSGFLCSLTAGITMFKLSRYCGLSKAISLITGILLMGTATIVLYIQDQSFPGWASAFLPLCFIPAIRMVKQNVKQINPVFFGGAVAILISIHTFTALMYVAAIIPFWIVGMFHSRERLAMFRDSILSVAVALVLGANTFFAMFELKGNKMIMPYPVEDLISKSIQFSTGAMSRYNLGLIFSFLAIFTIILGITYFNKISLVEKTIFITGVIFLFVSSKYLPWNSLANHIPALMGLQFPQRFAAIANVLLILSNGFFMMKIAETFKEDWRKLFTNVLLTFALLGCTWGLNSINEKAQQWRTDQLAMDGDRLIDSPKVVRQKFWSSDLSEAFETLRKSVPDYLPEYEEVKSPYPAYRKQIYENPTEFKKEVNTKDELVIRWEQSDSSEKVQVPVFIYNNSTINLNGQKIATATSEKTNIGALIVQGKAGANELIVGYEPSLLFKIGTLLKMVGLPLAIIYCIYYKFRWFKTKK